MTTAQVPHPVTLMHGLVYTTLQELATKLSHLNTGKALGAGRGKEVMSHLAADEGRHYMFYKGVATAALEQDPSGMIVAIEHEVRTFAMPGTGISGFRRHAYRVAMAGIYDPIIHYERILVPVLLESWKVDKLEGLSGMAEQALEQLMKFLELSKLTAARFAEKRDEKKAKAEAEV
jgi:acyl-[acyl-carrier-protein] desaturase